jgi:hypothetical protein
MGYSWAADRDETLRPSSPGHKLPCRVGPPFKSGVVDKCSCIADARDCAASDWRANPLSAHGGSRPPGAIDPILPVQGMQARSQSPTIRERCEPGRRCRASLPDFSEIYSRFFGKGSLLQVANATVVLENGHGLSSAIRIICFGAEILIQHPNSTHEAILAW